MNKPNKYEELRKLVYSIIHPDGIPLEFGCEIKTKNWGLEKAERITSEKTYEQKVFGCSGRVTGVRESKITEILGRPLSLQDVLRAISKKTPTEFLVDWEYEDHMLIRPLHKKESSLDLSLPISEQPKDVLEKLIELIK